MIRNEISLVSVILVMLLFIVIFLPVVPVEDRRWCDPVPCVARGVYDDHVPLFVIILYSATFWTIDLTFVFLEITGLCIISFLIIFIHKRWKK